MIGVVRTENNITLTYKDVVKALSSDHKDFKRVVDMWLNKEINNIISYLISDKVIVEEAFKHKGYEVKDGIVYINNKPVVYSIGQRILSYAKEGKNPDRLIKFWERLKQNPSYWCMQSLFDFLDKHRCPIAEDGRFMAYKCVRGNFTDKYTGKIDNSVGVKVAPFDRNEVDDDKMKDCSFGYHVGSAEYVRGFGDGGDKYIEVMVDPFDVVSIPADVTANKMRVCTYEVVKEVVKDNVNYETYNDSYGDDEEEIDDDEYGDDRYY